MTAVRVCLLTLGRVLLLATRRNVPNGPCFRFSLADYNEIILSAQVWNDKLPALIEAVFFPGESTRGEERARAVRSAFMAAFSEALDDGMPPLVRFWSSTGLFELVT